MPLHQSGDTCINYRCYNTSLKAKKKTVHVREWYICYVIK